MSTEVAVAFLVGVVVGGIITLLVARSEIKAAFEKHRAGIKKLEDESIERFRRMAESYRHQKEVNR